MKKRKAFTLIELIITISIMASLIAIAMPKTNIYYSYLKNRELRVFARDLNTARAKAVAEDKRISLHFLEGGSGYILVSMEDGEQRKVQLEYTKILTIPNSDLYFFPTGSFSSPRTIILEDYNKVKYEIRIGVGTSKITLGKVGL